MKRLRQAGFAGVEAVLIIIVLVGVIALGYMVMKRHSAATKNSAATTTTASSASSVPAAPEVKSTQDLTKAQQSLDDTNLDSGSDTSKLDAQLNSF
jgi:guanyl-specific ribonuclease Sa